MTSAYWKLRSSPTRPPVVGETAPAFVLPGLRQGASYALEQWRGQRVLLVFWAPWSAPALAQARTLRAATPPPGGVLVDVVLDYIDLGEVRSAVGPDAPDRIHLLGRPTELLPWGTFPTLPVTYVVDAEGKVRAVREGFLDAAALGRLALTD